MLSFIVWVPMHLSWCIFRKMMYNPEHFWYIPNRFTSITNEFYYYYVVFISFWFVLWSVLVGWFFVQEGKIQDKIEESLGNIKFKK
jgi:hypothetical protein